MPEKPVLPEVHNAHLVAPRNLPAIELDYDARVKSVIVHGRDKRVRKATRILKAALKGSEIGGDEYDYALKPEGWTNEQYRIAMDARKPKRDVPFYLEIARTVVSDADKAPEQAQQLNIGQVINVVQVSYPTKKLEEP
jgi:hypothetical protein